MALLLMLAMTSCSSKDTETTTSDEAAVTQDSNTTIDYRFAEEDYDDSYLLEDSTQITLNGASADITGDGASVSKGIVTISKAGTYVVSGTLQDGQLIIDAAKTDTVRIVLLNADITSSTASAIYAKQSAKTILILAEGTTNTVSDAASYTYEDAAQEEPNAAIFSKDDLTITGSGTLVVNGNFNHAIFTKNILAITNGSLQITSVNDGLKGKDGIAIANGKVNIQAGGDGMQASEDLEEGKGWVYIADGSFTIQATGDGIQAETNLEVIAGSFTITTGGGSVHASTTEGWGSWSSAEAEDETSAKGIKSGANMVLHDGTYSMDTSDDAIHSNADLTIQLGTYSISSGDDGIHADAALIIEQGELTITKSYEGLEGNTIELNGGTISVTSSDDGLNAAGGADGSSTNGRPGANSFSTDDSASITIQDGTLYVHASGDGLDSNGSLYIYGGTIFVDGPSSDGDGPLDYDGTCEITGGTLITAGRSGMAQMPGSSSTQNSVMITFSSNQAAGTQINLEQDGSNLVSFTPSVSFNNIVVSSAKLMLDTSYTLSSGGSVTGGTAMSQVMIGGTIAGSSALTDFYLDSVATSLDDSGNRVSAGMSGGGKGGMQGGPGGRP